MSIGILIRKLGVDIVVITGYAQELLQQHQRAQPQQQVLVRQQAPQRQQQAQAQRHLQVPAPQRLDKKIIWQIHIFQA